MKHLFTTFALALSLPVSAQTDAPAVTHTRPRGYNTLGIGMEVGGGLVPAPYVMTFDFKTKEHASIGYTLSYERQFNFGRRSGLILGVGANFTRFSSHVIHRNTRSYSYETQGSNGPIYITQEAGDHDLGRVKHFYFATDFPVLFTQTFARKNVEITPYAGVKVRNIFLIDAESTFRGHAFSAVETEDGDTTFAMRPTYRSRMYDNRIVLLPTIGVRVSKPMKNGGLLNFYADYNVAIYNNLEMRYSNLDNTERIATTVTQNGETTTTYENVDFDFENTTLIMAMRMSHLRTGISYTLPNRR